MKILRSAQGPGWMILAILLMPATLCAQYAPGSPVTADPEDREKEWGPFHAGGRIGLQAVFVDLNGSRDKYRTDLNYLPGFNLGEYSLRLDAREPGKGLLDYLRLEGEGIGNAYPYQQASLVFGKRSVYEFRGHFRRQEQFFSLPTFALGGRGEESARRLTDLSLRIFPHRNVTLEIGYYRNVHLGTSFNSAAEFQRLFEFRDPRRSLTQDFRIGGTVRGGPLFLQVTQNFRKYKDDPEAAENRLLQPAAALPEFRASAPVRLSVPSTSLLVRLAPSDRWDVEARYVYSDGHIEAGRTEFLALQIVQGVTLERILRATTVSDHPEHRFEVNASFDLTDRLVFSNSVEGDRFKIDGSYDATTTFRSRTGGSGQLDVPDQFSSSFEYAVLRTRPQLELFLHPRWSCFGGYEYGHRAVEETALARDVTVTHLGFAGTTVRPFGGARFTLELEKGTANDAFTRIEPRDVSRVRFSSHIPLAKGFSIAPHFLISDRDSIAPDRRYDASQRQGGIEVQYLHPDRGWMVSSGYALFDLDTLADIRFFLSGTPVSDVSRYSTHLHFFHSRAVVPLGSRVMLNLGYQLLRDPEGNSYPLRRDRGEAGLSIRTGSHWVWDLRWQHISYNEDLLSSQDYVGNLLSLGLRWSF